MLPSAIVAWADKYDILHTTVWEVIETVTDSGDGLNEIEDESHLLDLTVQWAAIMTENAYEDPTRLNTQSFLMYTLPVIYALAPYMTTDQRNHLIRATGIDTPILTDAMHIALDRSSVSPKPPAHYR